MPKLLLLFLLLIGINNYASNAQSLAGAPFNLQAAQWQSSANNNAKITINTNGITHNIIPGAYKDVRMYQKLTAPLPEQFTVGFNFTVTNVSNTGASLLPLVFTAGNQAPSNPENQPSVQTNQNALGILFQTPLNRKGELQIAPYVKIGATPMVNLYAKFISIAYNKAYTIILTKCNAVKANITVKLNGALVGSTDFTIATNLGNLNYVQVANLVQASQYRNNSTSAQAFFYTPQSNITCSNNTDSDIKTDPIKPIKDTLITADNGGVTDYEDMPNRPIDKLGPGCCQVTNVQYGPFKNGYITVGAKKYNPLMQYDCNDVLSMNKSIVFPGRRTIVYKDNNTPDFLNIPDTGVVNYTIYKNKSVSHTIEFVYTNRFNNSISEKFTQTLNGAQVPLLTNIYSYNKKYDDFPASCISYKNGDSSKYLKTTFFGKKSIQSFTVFNSETNNTVTYNVVRDKSKNTRFWRFSTLHYYIGLQTPENPNPLLNVFGFAGDLITDIIPEQPIDGAVKIHFDYTFIKNTSTHITSMRGTNGTDIVFTYDCNYEKPIRITPPPPTDKPKVVIKETPVDAPKEEIKKPRNVFNPKEMMTPTNPKEIVKPTKTDSVPTPIVPKKGGN
jgi:hypothetical protein